ncbi:MAG TPA: hypothetical protein VFZ93_08780 [Albitalea sp.]
MDITGALWHFSNFIAPAAGIGLIASILAKLLWFRALGGVAWWRLWAWASASSLVVLVAGLVVFGRDGKMATYGAMVLACATSLWWTGFRPGRR